MNIHMCYDETVSAECQRYFRVFDAAGNESIYLV